MNVDVFDPWCSPEEAKKEYNISLISKIKTDYYDSIIIAVGHEKFKNLGCKTIRSYGKKSNILFDLKYIFPKNDVDIRL
nr:UDP binding domain-containing protein [Providencia rustigianii]